MVPEMESLAKDMVEKCGGLPLAIVVLSGLLSHKKGLNEWQMVKDHLWKNIKEDKSIEISNILSLSYNDLSTALKQCFLYFGIFPEDQVVRADNIIWLWMAEGFIPRGEERMEDVAEGFLNELIRRSLVQVAKTFWERVPECRVHDLLRDLAIQKALEVNFFDIYDPRSHSISSLCIRHVIHSEGESYLSLDLSNLKLRSIMFFDPYFLKMSLKNFRSVFQHLYVLYFGMGVRCSVPDDIGSLYHLKFLSLRGMDDLPSSIGNLKNLQTLVVDTGGYTCQLPQKIADLINLRHLVARYDSKPLVHINKLTSLQVVDGICCDQWKDVDPVDLVNLRELRMNGISKSYSLNNISSLKNLSTLALFGCIEESFPDLEFVNCCEKLQTLWLSGRIEKLPHLFPNSITMIALWNSTLTEDPMPILGMLPNLRNLQLFSAYEGKEIMCSDNSFSQLEFLHLRDLEKLERWHLGTSAMPLIKGLDIYDCPNLKEIPERMKNVEQLNRNYMLCGTKNQATLFNKHIETWKDSLKPKSYYIAKGRLDSVNPNYSSVHKEVELAFTDNTIIQETEHAVSTHKFSDGFLSLEHADKLPNGSILDLICVLVSVNPLIQNANSKRREIVVTNQLMEHTTVTLWGDFVENDGAFLEKLQDNKPILALCDVKVSIYKGRFGISTIPVSSILINPMFQKANDLRAWIVCTSSKQQLKTYSIKMSHGIRLAKSATKK
ncbi:putative disease resistance RPP13-like protein 3 [Solanum verrucosum]|uniref:putative disease resistance RPP13-like protein 3 n=1 Tax=Solanum verrucosum TaxID=315347 RepID=UPI0020D01550|nr:putative disease resistance RPP13-like protein 3 [Solanum verrucosum]